MSNYLLRICRPHCFSKLSQKRVMTFLSDLTEPRSTHDFKASSNNRKRLLKTKNSAGKEEVKKRVRYSYSTETDLEEEWKQRKDKTMKIKRTELQTFPRLVDKSPLTKEDHTDSELVKHIEVLQRFAERYNAVQDSKIKQKVEDAKRHKKHLDEQQKSSFSTLVGRSSNKANRPYLSLAQEVLPVYKRKKTMSVKPTVPKIKFDVNPDSIQLQGKAPKRSVIKLYSLQNTFMRNQNTQSRQEKAKQGRRAEDSTVGDYYFKKYPRIQQPKGHKVKKSDPLSKRLKEGLVERRKSELEPEIEVTKPKIPSTFVKPSHLPIELCSNMKSYDKQEQKQETTRPTNKQQTTNPPTSSPIKRDRDTAARNNIDSILRKLIKYFKR